MQKKFHDAGYYTTFFNRYIQQRAIVFTIAVYQTINCVILSLNDEFLKGPIHAHSFFTPL